MARYLACPENLLHAYQKQLTALNCQLDVLTVPSQSQELCELWGLKPEIMAQLLRPPHPGELASRYFKLFKESDLCRIYFHLQVSTIGEHALKLPVLCV